MPKNATNIVRARIPEILAGIREGKTIGEIASEHGVTTRTIGYNMVSPEFQKLLKQTMGESLNIHFKRIDELWSSEDPDDRRESSRELGRMIRALIPKLNVEQSESYNVDVRVDGVRRLIASLPYEERRKALSLFEEGKVVHETLNLLKGDEKAPITENLG